MIIEQIENVEKEFHGAPYDYQSDTHHNIGVYIRSSGHLLTISRRTKSKTRNKIIPADRKEVRDFSASSACRMRKFLRESVAKYDVMVTLTYPGQYGFDPERAKRDLKVFMQRLRRRCFRSDSSSAFWFMEFQDRGSIHFHIFTNFYVPKEWLALNWYEVCGTEDKRHLRAGTRVEAIRSGRHGISAYATKYASKQQQKLVPEGISSPGRYWGVCGDRRTVSADTFVSLAAKRDPLVMRKVNRIDELLEHCVFIGEARRIFGIEGGVEIYSFKSELQLSVFRMKMENINNLIATRVKILNDWICLDNELFDEDISINQDEVYKTCQ